MYLRLHVSCDCACNRSDYMVVAAAVVDAMIGAAVQLQPRLHSQNSRSCRCNVCICSIAIVARAMRAVLQCIVHGRGCLIGLVVRFWREIRDGCVGQQDASWIRSSYNWTLPGVLWHPVCFASSGVASCVHVCIALANLGCMAAAALLQPPGRFRFARLTDSDSDRLRSCICMSSV